VRTARLPLGGLANNRVVFNIKGNKDRLDTRMAYRTSVVVVKRIGPHAEYDRWTFTD
jgi:mRNA interferase HigB